MKKLTIALLCLGMSSAVTLADPKKNPSTGHLPPGLEKKAATGQLPPGWEKKLVVGKPLDLDIYRHSQIVVPIDDRGLLTVRIEGKLIRLIDATREVVEVLD